MKQYFLRHGVAAFITLATIICQTACRDLRPSEHGLAYQEDAASPTQYGNGQQMLSFFGSTASSVPLPESRNVSEDTWWSVHGHGRSRDTRRDHLRIALLVASAVCGTAGAVLLVVSGIVLLFRRRKQKAEAVRLSPDSEFKAVE